uniref:Tetraspanin n=1 Tax=Schistosoma haematobium TaxID=6185 RepID=A0A094ZKE5_SCHHA
MRFKNESVDKNFDKSDSYRDWIQKSLHCCGINGMNDYPGLTVPLSCCIPKHRNCPDKSASYTIGCKQVINDLVKEKFLMAIILIMSVPVSKLFALLFAILLCCSVKQRNEVEYTEVQVNV